MEEIVCIVKDARPAGMFTQKDAWAFNQYDLFFTNKRIIAAVTRTPRDSKTAHARAKPQILAGTDANLEKLEEMVSTFRQWMDIQKERREQFKGKTPEEILRLHPSSFEINYKNIKSVKIKKWSLFGTVLEIRYSSEIGEKKIKFSIPRKRFEDVRKVINRYF